MGAESASMIVRNTNQLKPVPMKKLQHSHLVATTALSINAIKLNVKEPFQWASGYRMPIYNDNRRFLWDIDHRHIIVRAFRQLIIEAGVKFEVVAGTSTAGIPWATLLSNEFGFHLAYIREKAKGHGLKNRIEGIDAETGLAGQRTLVIEDLISTGGSSAKAVQAVRDAGGKCEHIISIFDYGFSEARKMFEDMYPPCKVLSILDYPSLMNAVRDKKYFDEEEFKALREWREDPYGWGEKRGFPQALKEKV